MVEMWVSLCPYYLLRSQDHRKRVVQRQESLASQVPRASGSDKALRGCEGSEDRERGQFRCF